MNIAIILAAGKGSRFGSPKQFALIKNKPVISYSLEKFNRAPDVNRIIVVTAKSKISYVSQLAKRYRFHKISDVIAGGKERQDSVKAALQILPDLGYVTIHDAARPLFNKNLIEQGFRQVKKLKAVIPVLPIRDTIKKVKDDKVIKTIDRTQLYYVQTPQFFEIKLLKKVYQKAYQDNYYATDDANLFERVKYEVYTIDGNKQNIKITDKQDLEIIKNFL